MSDSVSETPGTSATDNLMVQKNWDIWKWWEPLSIS